MKKWIVKDYGMPFLLALFICIYPWITIKCEIGISESEMAIFDNRLTGLLDLFLYGKLIFLVIFAIIFAIILLYIRLKKHEKLSIMFIKKERLFILSAVFLVLSFMSLILSDYKDVAFRGNSNSLEGFIAILAYFVLFFASIFVFSKEDNFLYLKLSCIVLGIITIVLTLIEIFYEPISKIIIGDSWSSSYANMTALTFYNSVYFAVFLVMLTSIVFSLFLYEKNIKLSILSGFIFIGLIFANISTRSTMALYVTISIIVLMIIIKIIVAIKEKKIVNKKELCTKHLLYKMVIPILFVILFAIINIANNNSLINTLFASGINATANLHKDNYYKINDIKSENGKIVFSSDDSYFVIYVDEDNNLKFDSDEMMNMYMDGDVIKFNGKFEPIEAWLEGGFLTIDLGYQDPIYFGINNQGVFPVMTDGRIINNIDGNNLGLDRFYNIATGRGFYWVNSLPIIKDCIVIGHGLGTFGLYFNQFDYVGNLNTHGTVLTMVDHPHNLYIQIAVQTGVISLIAFILAIIICIICGIRKINVLNNNRGFMIGTIIAVIGFMVCGLTTDSMLTTTPLFCVFLGSLIGFKK